MKQTKSKSNYSLILFVLCFQFTLCAQNNSQINSLVQQTGTVTDFDNNVYQTILIGNQWWMAENLRTSRYNDGEQIPYITDDGVWGSLNTPGYCYYNNDSVNLNGHGAIYNWHTVNTGKLAPDGWHIPTKEEFEILAEAVNNSSNALKAVGQGTGSGAGTNTSGFSALLSGVRVGGLFFFNRGWNTYFLSSSQFNRTLAHTMNLYYDDNNINPMPKYKNEGFSVRCIKDLETSARFIEQKEQITIYPNPIKGDFYINLPGVSEASVLIYTLSGEQKCSQKIYQNINLLNFNELQKGIYLLMIQSEQFVKTQKIIFQ